MLAKDTASVYVVECNGLYKIGMSGSVSRRISSLQTATPYDVKLVDTFESDVAFEMEQHLHHVFAEKNVQGEWFSLDDADLERVRWIAEIFPDQLTFIRQFQEVSTDNADTTEADAPPDGCERLWICPLCDFLTDRPGLCMICTASGNTRKVEHTLQFVAQVTKCAKG